MLLKELSGLTYLTLCQANGTLKLEDLLNAVKARAKQYDTDPIYDGEIETALTWLIMQDMVYEPENGILKIV